MKNYIVSIKFPRFQRTFITQVDNLEEVYSKASKQLYRLRHYMTPEMLNLKFKADIEILVKNNYYDTLPSDNFIVYTTPMKRHLKVRTLA